MKNLSILILISLTVFSASAREMDPNLSKSRCKEIRNELRQLENKMKLSDPTPADFVERLRLTSFKDQCQRQGL